MSDPRSLPALADWIPSVPVSEWAETAQRVMWRQAFIAQFAQRAPQAWERLLDLEHYATAFILGRRTALTLSGLEAERVMRMADAFLGTLTREVTRWAIDWHLDIPWIVTTAVSTLRARASLRDHHHEVPDGLVLQVEGTLVAHPDGVDILERTGRLQPFSRFSVDIPTTTHEWDQINETVAQFKRRVKAWVDDEIDGQLDVAREAGQLAIVRPLAIPNASRIDWTIDAYVLDLLPETILKRPGPRVTKEAIRLGIRETAAILGLPPREWDERARRWRIAA